MRLADLTWLLAGAAFALFVLTVVWTVTARRQTLQRARDAGDLWEDAHALAARLARGEGEITDGTLIDELMQVQRDPAPVVLAFAAVARTWGDGIADLFFQTVITSSIDQYVRIQLVSDDSLDRINGLETVEVLRLATLFGEVANLAHADDEQVVRAAVDALVVLDPSVATGVIVGLTSRCGSWTLDSLGRATKILSERGSVSLPTSRPQWRDTPMIAEQAMASGGMPEAGTASDALSVLIEALDSTSSQKRLAAVNALANTIDHPGAQIALAGALSAPDRLTRFAAASRLAESAAGRAVLQRAVASEESPDAATMAAQVLWTIPGPDGVAAGQGAAPLTAVEGSATTGNPFGVSRGDRKRREDSA